jgi:4-diphosphocytidyl-2-C-methyl-D-erythritol kinase
MMHHRESDVSSDVFVRAYAKVNLFLHVLARESGGYHSIETMFQRIALHDDVRVRLQQHERSLACSGPAAPPGGIGVPEANLAWQAAAAYMREGRLEAGWHIDITKRIPVGGGLGGGSADAAAVLRALERLSPKPIGELRLMQLALRLGSDVPFLLTGWSRALAWSRGERMLQLPGLGPRALTLVTFTEGVNTADAYRALAQARSPMDVMQPRALTSAIADSWRGVASLAFNDFEEVVTGMHPGVRAMLPALRTAAAPLRNAFALLSGSGATCFLVHDEAEAPEVDVLEGAALVRSATIPSLHP